jgi:hypothetical protein
LPTTSFTGATVETSIADSDLVLIYDDSATAVRKMTKANLVAGIGASAGQVIQVVQTIKTDTFSTAGNSFVDITGLSASITPSSSSNKILIICHIGILSTGTGGSCAVRLLKASTEIGGGTAAGNRLSGIARTAAGANADHGNGVSFQFLDSPATTSSTTYKVQAQGQTSFTAYVNRSDADTNVNESYGTRTSSTLTLLEIKG